MTFAFDFHPEAEAELAADVDWYDAREPGVGGRLAEAVLAAVAPRIFAWHVPADRAVSSRV